MIKNTLEKQIEQGQYTEKLLHSISPILELYF